MVRGVLSSAFVLAWFVAVSPAGAVSINFATIADNIGEQGATSFLFNNVGGSGISITMTARDLTDGAGITEGGLPNPYLDGNLGGLPGGAGVCQSLDPMCTGNPDDNLGVGGGLGEVLILMFSTNVALQQITFRNGDHLQTFVGSTGINVGAGNPTTAETFNNIFAASATLNPSLNGTRFSFVSDESFVAGSMGVQSQLYIESVTFIPEPSTASLAGLGLLALGALRRRRHAA